MKISEIKNIIENQIRTISESPDGSDVYYVGVPLKSKFMSIAIELSFGYVSRMVVMISRDNTKPYQMQFDYGDYKSSSDFLNDYVIGDVNEDHVRKFLTADDKGLAFIKSLDFEPVQLSYEQEQARLYNERYQGEIKNPELSVAHVVDCIKTNASLIANTITEFEYETPIARDF